MSFADEIHKHKPKDIKPQGSGSTLDADKVDGLHASEIGGGGGTDERIKVSASDITTDYLQPKLVAGTGITLTKQNPSGNENLKIDAHSQLHALDSASDHSGAITDAQHGTKTSIPDAHHRKWSWADEQAWSKTFRIPLGLWKKSANNPLLTGTPAQWDAGSIYMTSCAYRNGKTYLFYYAGSPLRIGVAYAADLEGPFSKSVNNPILSPGATGTWDAQMVIYPKVIFDEVDNKWKMWYEGRDASGVKKIGLATADDPEGPWTKDPSNPCTVPNYYGGGFSVLRMGNRYYGLSNKDATWVLKAWTSDDGKTWVERGDVTAANNQYATVWWNLGVWYLMYMDGNNVSPTYMTILMAYNWKGFGLFSEDPQTPVLSKGASFTWDSYYVNCPNLLMINEKFYCYFNGNDGTITKVGVALIP